MNNAFDYDKLIRLNLSKGINDVTTIGLLISAGLNPQSATQRLNAVKDSLNSKEESSRSSSPRRKIQSRSSVSSIRLNWLIHMI